MIDQLKAAVQNANTVMDGAAVFIGGLRQRLADATAAAQAGDWTQIDTLQSDLNQHAGALASAMAENTSAAPAESPTPASAPVVDPAAAPVDAAAPTS